ARCGTVPRASHRSPGEPIRPSGLVRARRGVRSRLKVEGSDVVVVERGDEALDLRGHVVVRELLDVLDERVGPLVEQGVVALDVGLAVHAGGLPLTLRAPALDLPAAGGQLVPG